MVYTVSRACTGNGRLRVMGAAAGRKPLKAARAASPRQLAARRLVSISSYGACPSYQSLHAVRLSRHPVPGRLVPRRCSPATPHRSCTLQWPLLSLNVGSISVTGRDWSFSRLRKRSPCPHIVKLGRGSSSRTGRSNISVADVGPCLIHVNIYSGSW